VNLAAYNTRESAADLDALRRALGVEQLDLLAISYGAHLGLAALKFHPSAFRSVVLVSPEGLDDTVKLPAATDEFFKRVQLSIDADLSAKAAYPDIAAMMRRVIARITATPVTVAVTVANSAAHIVLGAFEIQTHGRRSVA
jgi:pimeloyl-ACP methyl ester carboxylesterase